MHLRAVPSSPAASPPIRRRISALAGAGVLLAAGYARPLGQLLRLAAGNQLYSYVLLVPLISAFMVWSRRSELPPPGSPDRLAAAGLAGLGLALAAAGLRLGSSPALQLDALIVLLLSFVAGLAAITAWFLGRPLLRALGYPLAFLALMAPIPEQFSGGLQHALQHASATVAYVFLEAVNTPVFSPSDLVLQVPGITLGVAPECSGLRSSVALFVVSLPAGYVFLNSPWSRLVLALVVLPLGIVRNAFRILTIAELCVHIGPQMIDSYVHRKGGWIFFLISLVPLLLVILGLMRWEHGRGRIQPAPKHA